MIGWTAYLEDAPSRVVEVIEAGPMPLVDYDYSKLPWHDKKRGMMRYKGGDSKHKMKQGTPAVVYFDIDFCEEKFRPIDVPDEVTERHAHSQVVEAFKKL